MAMNSARVITGGRSDPNASLGWMPLGTIDSRASPLGVDHRSTLRIWRFTAMRYPITPCAPGARPVVIEVRPVAVVVGHTVVMAVRGSDARVGARCARSSSWSQPSPSITNRALWRAPTNSWGIHAGTSPDGSSSVGTMAVTHAPA